MPWLVALALLVVPIVEIFVIIQVGQVIGGWPTVGLLIIESALGAWLVKREGRRAWNALQSALQTGRMPGRELTDGALVLIGGTLLLTPGFVTDVAGFFFILPLTRPIARAWLEVVVTRRLLGPMGEWPASGGRGGPADAPRRPAGPDVVEGEVVQGHVVDPGAGPQGPST